MNHRVRVLNTAILVLILAAMAAQLGCGDRSSPSTKTEQLRLAADQGHASAQYRLGFMYANGEDVPEDDAEAVRWWRLAAEQGDAEAQNNLGLQYNIGEGAPQDSQEAVKWFRLAAEQGHASAQYNLGLLYASGAEGVTQDYQEAVRWYLLAAGQGHADAQFYLGRRYTKGEGVPQDYVQAHKWVNLAASRTPPEMGGYRSLVRDSLAEEMTALQIAEAQRLAREWEPKTWEQLKDE